MKMDRTHIEEANDLHNKTSAAVEPSEQKNES